MMMIEILMLSQSAVYVGSLGLVVAGGALTWLIKRDVKKVVEHCDDRQIHPNPDDVKKVVEHCDDRRIHVNPDNGYVRADRCELLHDGLKATLGETKEALNNVHKRIDSFIAKQADDTQTILQAIQDGKQQR